MRPKINFSFINNLVYLKKKKLNTLRIFYARAPKEAASSGKRPPISGKEAVGSYLKANPLFLLKNSVIAVRSYPRKGLVILPISDTTPRSKPQRLREGPLHLSKGTLGGKTRPKATIRPFLRMASLRSKYNNFVKKKMHGSPKSIFNKKKSTRAVGFAKKVKRMSKYGVKKKVFKGYLDSAGISFAYTSDSAVKGFAACRVGLTTGKVVPIDIVNNRVSGRIGTTRHAFGIPTGIIARAAIEKASAMERHQKRFFYWVDKSSREGRVEYDMRGNMSYSQYKAYAKERKGWFGLFNKKKSKMVSGKHIVRDKLYFRQLPNLGWSLITQRLSKLQSLILLSVHQRKNDMCFYKHYFAELNMLSNFYKRYTIPAYLLAKHKKVVRQYSDIINTASTSITPRVNNTTTTLVRPRVTKPKAYVKKKKRVRKVVLKIQLLRKKRINLLYGWKKSKVFPNYFSKIPHSFLSFKNAHTGSFSKDKKAIVFGKPTPITRKVTQPTKSFIFWHRSLHCSTRFLYKKKPLYDVSWRFGMKGYSYNRSLVIFKISLRTGRISKNFFQVKIKKQVTAIPQSKHGLSITRLSKDTKNIFRGITTRRKSATRAQANMMMHSNVNYLNPMAILLKKSCNMLGSNMASILKKKNKVASLHRLARIMYTRAPRLRPLHWWVLSPVVKRTGMVSYKNMQSLFAVSNMRHHFNKYRKPASNPQSAVLVKRGSAKPVAESWLTNFYKNKKLIMVPKVALKVFLNKFLRVSSAATNFLKNNVPLVAALRSSIVGNTHKNNTFGKRKWVYTNNRVPTATQHGFHRSNSRSVAKLFDLSKFLRKRKHTCRRGYLGNKILDSDVSFPIRARSDEISLGLGNVSLSNVTNIGTITPMIMIAREIKTILGGLPRRVLHNFNKSDYIFAMFMMSAMLDTSIWTSYLNKIFYRTPFFKQRRLFYTLRRLLKPTAIACASYSAISGMYFSFRGKIATKAGLRKKVLMSRFGLYTSSNFGLQHKYRFKQIWSKSGAIGLRTIITCKPYHRTYLDSKPRHC